MLIIIWQESPEVNLNILSGFYLVGIFFIWTKYKPGNSHKPSTLVDKSQKIQKKQVCYLCHIIRYFLISFALAVQGNIGPWSFLYGSWVVTKSVTKKLIITIGYLLSQVSFLCCQVGRYHKAVD